jgi:hypothetical protein
MSAADYLDRLLGYREASQYVGLSLRQFRREFIDSGIISIVRVSLRSPRIRLSELNACLEKRTFRARAQIAP